MSRFVDRLAERGAARNAVGEPGGELLHLAGGIGESFFNQHPEVGADHFVAVALAGFVVATGCSVLGNLAEDPGIGSGGAADHDRVASGLRNHRAGVLGCADIAVADDRNFDRLLDGRDPLPARIAAIALLARAGVQGDATKPTGFREFREFHADNFLVVPAGAELHRKGDLYGGANSFKDFSDGGKIAQQARPAVALDDLLRRTTEIQVDQVETKAFDHARGFCHDLGIASEKLCRDGMLVFIKMKIAFGLLVLSAEDAIGRGELGHNQATAGEIANEATEDRVGDARHWGKHGGGSNLDGAQAQYGRYRGEFLADGCFGSGRRVVPVLAHVVILAGPATESPRFARGLRFWFLAKRITSLPPRPWRRRFWRTCGGSAPHDQRCPAVSACR